MLIGGIKVNYFFHCKTQLWLFSHFVTQEQESDLVVLGKILEESVFKEIKSKNILIDQTVSLDFIKKGTTLIVFDIKKSSKFYEAHYHQLLYYLWYLKKIKGISNVKGILSYPKEKRKEEITLTPKDENKLSKVLLEINKIVSLKTPPKPIFRSYCKKCSYFEFCFSD